MNDKRGTNKALGTTWSPVVNVRRSQAGPSDNMEHTKDESWKEMYGVS